ncbi:hypothetical protein D9M68_841760 [compost metagenome]
MPGLERVALLVVVVHRLDTRLDHHHPRALALDPADQVFAQRALSAARLADHRDEPTVAGRLPHGLAHVADVGRDKHVLVAADRFDRQRVHEQPEVLLGRHGQG